LRIWRGICIFIISYSVCSADKIAAGGASFPYPIIALWAKQYHFLTKNKINYQTIGSSGGIKQVIAGTFDFATTEKPLAAQELQRQHLLQFPLIIGGVVPVVHLDGFENNAIVLSGEVLAKIFLGKIQNWSDEEIAVLNPGLKLPAHKITLIHRADGSGTTFLFTHYLTQISREWSTRIGTDVIVSWPMGVGGKGNAGVALYLQQINGAIGYLEYTYAMYNQLHVIQLLNAQKQIVQPSFHTFQSAAMDANWHKSPPVLTNQMGMQTWPITGVSYLIISQDHFSKNSKKLKPVLNFLEWVLQNGHNDAIQLGYAPLPKFLQDKNLNTWKVLLMGHEH
jgi:phosphate transport system substrate-binding protein